jgi:CheY-like chemotaxis protein/HPt (histidine-containing phosphotransfer) domain-containing protein
LRILVAEDREINRRLASLMLERLGYQAEFVENGREAVEAAQNASYDLIFMDCQMPVMDGYEATREIRCLEAEAPPGRRHRSRILAMTANAISDNRAKCLAAGMDGFISKPVRIELLREVLEAVPSGPAESEGRADAEREAGIATLRAELGDQMAAEMLALFLRDTPERIAEAQQWWEKQDWDRLARTAHMMAGSCGIFGLNTLRMTCLCLEEASRHSAREETEVALAGIERGFRVVRPGLAKRLQDLSPPPAG